MSLNQRPAAVRAQTKFMCVRRSIVEPSTRSYNPSFLSDTDVDSRKGKAEDLRGLFGAGFLGSGGFFLGGTGLVAETERSRRSRSLRLLQETRRHAAFQGLTQVSVDLKVP